MSVRRTITVTLEALAQELGSTRIGERVSERVPAAEGDQERMKSSQIAVTDVASPQLSGGTGLVGRPRVFVSSTIYDFRDLRSALKWWLEQMGCEVRMSEFTDFARPPEQGAFNSCFAAIQDSHFYVLLIGGRRGSWYDKDNLVSVTRQEFRVAAELARQGKLVPVVFLRKEVVAALRDWRSRAKYRSTITVAS